MLLKSDEQFRIHNGDCIKHIPDMPRHSVDMSVFSPPFPAMFSYSPSANDMGNSEDLGGDGKLHFSFFFNQMLHVMKPGRVMVVHCTQIPRMKRIDSRGGLQDFRGLLIRLAERAGFTYEYEWSVRKNPQAQAIRTRSRELQFSGLESDRSNTRGCNPDFLIKFKAPGENAVPIDSEGQVTRNEWIEWAENNWTDIRETDTLNTKNARTEEHTRHICPLQLGVIDRLVRLFSNPKEIVFSPFTGIGSEGYQALKLGRRFYGCELLEEYHAEALVNCERALRASPEEAGLFAAKD